MKSATLSFGLGFVGLAATAVGAGFRVVDTAASRLETVAGSPATVTVPVVREAGDSAAYRISVGGAVSPVSWADGATLAYPQVAVPAQAAGTNCKVELLNAADAVVATTYVHVVADPGNSIRNPWWVGEKTADELGYGEWTMDLDVAKEKLATAGEDAHLLIRISGDLWCPHCQASLVRLWETPEFIAWAKANNVILVSVDQADGQTSYDNWETALGSFFNYNEDWWPDPASPRDGRHGASGAAYLSRHGISAETAKAAYARCMDLNMNVYLRPSSTAKRNGMGTLVLIDADGNEICRPATYGASDTYPVAENLARFTAALDVTSAKATEPTWTDREHAAGSEEPVSLQVNDATAYYRLTGLEVGRLDVAYVPEFGKEPVTVTIYAGEATSLSTVITGEGAVSFDITPEMRDADNLWVCLKSFKAASKTEYGDDNRISGTLKSELVETPGQIAFAAEAVAFSESDGSGTIRLVRRGGVFGPAQARVVWKGGVAQGKRYEWTDATVSWAADEGGEKTVSFKLIDDGVAEGRESFRLGLEVEAPVSAGTPSTCMVVVNDSTRPELELPAYAETVDIGFGIRKVYPVSNLTGGRVKVDKLGKLPSGLKLKYDKSAHAVVLTGVPKKAGVYSVDIVLREWRDSGYVAGQPSSFVISVKDAAAFNPLAVKGFGSVAVPLFDADKAMCGLVTVKSRGKGRVSGIYSGVLGKITFSGRWSDLDEATGVASVTLGKKGNALRLALSPDGALAAELDDARREISLSSEAAFAPCADVSPYVGLYTVTLPLADESAKGMLTGTATLTLRAYGDGKVLFKGRLPNGKSVSGRAYLLDDGDRAILPIFVSKSKGKSWFGAAFAILPDAALLYADGNPVIISELEGTTAAWGFKDRKLEGSSALAVYGGYYASDFDLVDCCLSKYSSSYLTVAFDVNRLACDGTAYAIADAIIGISNRGLGLAEADKGFKIKMKSKSGLVYGKSVLIWANGTRTPVTFKGVVLPGWTDCGCGALPPPERPFISGTAYFKAKVNGQVTMCSVPVDAIPKYGK